MTTEFESTVSFEVLEKCENIRLIDIMDGSVYKIPDFMVKENGGSRFLLNMPIKDSPLLLTFGNF